MKKTFKIVLLMLIAILPVIVKADMAAPGLLDYEAIVVKEGGADYYEWKGIDAGYVKVGHLDKDTVITVNILTRK